MAKTVTLRLSDEEYEQISTHAENDHRPISNFITHMVLRAIENFTQMDVKEMAEINADKGLQERLKKAHKEAKQNKGKLIE